MDVAEREIVIPVAEAVKRDAAEVADFRLVFLTGRDGMVAGHHHGKCRVVTSCDIFQKMTDCLGAIA